MVSKCKQLKGVFGMFWGIINHDCALDSNLFVIALHYCAFNLLCENFDLGRFQSETTAAAAIYSARLSPDYTAACSASSSNIFDMVKLEQQQQ